MLDAAPARLDAPGPGAERRAEPLKAWLRDYCARRLHAALNDERRAIPPHIVLDFGNEGLLGMPVARCDGGLGLSHADFVEVLEQLAAIDTSLCLFVGLSNVLGIRPLQRFGSQAARARWLRPLARGRALGAFALTEPGAGANPIAMQTTARPCNGGYVINGTKHYIGNAGWSAVLYVFARTFDRAGAFVGVTGFAVPSDAPGLTVGPEARTMGMRCTAQSRVELRDVEVPAANILGEVGGGLEVAQDTMAQGRLVIAAAAVGAMKRCARLMHRYAGRRQVATGRLLDHPVTREKLAALACRIEAVEAITQTVTARLDAGLAVPPSVFAACKIAASELLDEAADDLVQLLGARGYVETNHAPQIYRDARILRIFEGPTEVLAAYLGSIALKNPDELRAYLATDPETGARFERHLAQLAALRDAVHGAGGPAGAVDRKLLLRDLAGRLTTLFLLRDAVPDGGATAGWLDDRYGACAAAASARAALAGRDVASLERLMARYADEIGDVETPAGGEDHALDPYLMNEMTL